MTVLPAVVQSFQGSQVVDVPVAKGIYAWYFSPATISASEAKDLLPALFGQPGRLRAQVQFRYGMNWTADCLLALAHGAQRRQTSSVVDQSLSAAETFIRGFLVGGSLPWFARPLYIGIAKNLCRRIYQGHYMPLTDYWDDDSGPSRYLKTNPGADVAEVMAALDIPHSFALEARTCRLSPRDLVVYTHTVESLPEEEVEADEMDESGDRKPTALRPLELLLQLLADPVFGRR